MDKVTLIAKTLVAYGGRTYGENMQFVVPADVAERFISHLKFKRTRTYATLKAKGYYS